jgi:hypothetical protein
MDTEKSGKRSHQIDEDHSGGGKRFRGESNHDATPHSLAPNTSAATSVPLDASADDDDMDIDDTESAESDEGMISIAVPLDFSFRVVPQMWYGTEYEVGERGSTGDREMGGNHGERGSTGDREMGGKAV